MYRRTQLGSRRSAALCVGLMLWLTATEAVGGNVWYAKADAVGGEACDGPQTAGLVTDALAKASADDEIVLLPGTYDRSGQAQLEITKKVTIRSQSGNSDDVVFVGGGRPNPGRAMSLTREAAGTTVSGITFRNFAEPNAHGGAVNCITGSCSFVDCTFEGCVAGDSDVAPSSDVFNGTGRGGAIYGNGMIVGCRFVGNCASSAGGGVYFHNFGSVTNCVFAFNCVSNNVKGTNTRLSGGGISLSTQHAVTAVQCSFVSNCAVNTAGDWAQNGAGNFNSERCLFDGNIGTINGSAVRGGTHVGSVFVNSVGEPMAMGGRFVDCVFSNNMANIVVANGGTFRSCLFFGNQGGNLMGNSVVHNCTAISNVTVGSRCAFIGNGGELVNAIFEGNNFANNAISDCVNGTFMGTPPVVSNSVIEGYVYAGWTNDVTTDHSNLRFVGTGDNPWVLRRSSFGVNRGQLLSWMTDGASAFDLAGNPRVVGDAPDYGAYEYNPPMSFVIVVR